MVLEKDDELKQYQKEDFQKTSDRIIELNEQPQPKGMGYQWVEWARG